MEKRGQITLFIIIGVIILFSVFTFFYLRSRVIEREVAEELPAVEKVPLEFEPIRLFTQNCLQKIGTEAVKILGEQGGYIDPESFGANIIPQNPTESDALEFAPGSELYVPYWWYLKAPNKCKGNCLFSSMRPSLHRAAPGDSSIESQIDAYIEQEIQSCLNDYAAFEIQGFEITPVGELKSRTRVTASDIALSITYPLKTKLGESSYTIENFYATVPVDLEKIYNLATDITDAQIEHHFLEKQMLDLLNAFTGLDANKLPPMSATVYTTEKSLMWPEAAVRERLQEILMIYVPAFQVYNTLNFAERYMPDPLQAAIYQAAELPIKLSRESQPYSDLAATFSYLAWWPVYFDVNSKGGIIKGEQAVNDLAELFSVGIVRYHTVYDLSYPVVIEIKDPAALNNQGYIFRFALESNFRNNEPIDERFQGLEGVIMFESSLLCNENQKNSGGIKIKTIDAVTDEPVPGVSVGFQCGEEGCPMGETGENGMLVSKFPLCLGGLLVLRHPGYFAPTLYLSTNYNESIDLPAVELYPFIDKEISVRKFNLAGFAGPVDLEPADEAIVSLTRVPDFEGDQKHIAIARVFGNQSNSSRLRLIPGKYEVEINLFYHQPVVIPEEEREAGFWPFQEEYTIPEVRINDSYLRGGITFSQKTGYFVLPEDKLYANNTLAFNIVYASLPAKVEELYDPSLSVKFTAEQLAMLNPVYT